MRPGSHHRAAGLALVALFVLGQGALFAHQLLVPHQACAEHDGELIHVAIERRAPAPDAPSWSYAQALEAPHGHDHCLAFASRRHDTAPAFTPREAPVRVEHAAASIPATSAAVFPREVRLLLAPKSSPPV